MQRLANRHRLGALAFGLLASPSLLAQEVDASYGKAFGNDYAGAEILMGAGAAFDTSSASYGFLRYEAQLSASLEAELRLLESKLEAVRFRASASAERAPSAYANLGWGWGAAYRGSAEASASLRLAGATIYTSPSTWSTDGTLEKSVDRTLGPYDIFPVDPEIKLWAGLIPITITGNAGAEAMLGCTLALDAANTQLTVGGSVEGYLYGWAGVHIGVACLYIGADLRLEFGRSELDLDVAASSGSLGGTLRYGITPVRLVLDLVASACVTRRSWTLIDLAMDEISGSKRLF